MIALRIVEHAGRTDVGRQRSANEDDFVLSPPFFAVADGMGGAKAGEVASAMATEGFEGESDSGEPAEAQLARILREANRRIYDLAVADESHRGMGTTLTAAKVTGDDISLGHVGDSRAYRMRDGELEQLTKDHSLVAELERSGQITPEAAEHHPQRSIITRALGPPGRSYPSISSRAGPRLDCGATRWRLVRSSLQNVLKESRDVTAGEFSNEMADSAEGRHRVIPVGSALKAIARFGREHPGSWPAGESTRMKIGAFEQDSPGLIGNLSIEPAHDAANGRGSLSIVDHEHLGIELPFHSVQRDQPGPGFARATTIFPPRNRRKSKACSGCPSSSRT